MDRVHVIRHKLFIEGKSARAVAKELGHSRNTIAKYRDQAEPERVETAPRPTPKRDLVEPRITEIWTEWKSRTTRKQRLTATRIHKQLRKEGYDVGITLVRTIVREIRQREREVYVPLVHRPGDSAQVDFFEVTVEVAGERRKAWMFVMRLMYSGRDFAWIYERCDQLAFLDGHVRAFEHFGAIPHRLVYDNLKPAVKKILKLTRRRELTGRFQALVSHYLFEPCFARPGEGHDKGGVEARGKGIRLQYLTPIPRGESLAEISTEMMREITEDAQSRRRREQKKTIAELFNEERPMMLQRPERPFEARRFVATSASAKSLVKLEGGYYSVPCRWARKDVDAWVGVDHVEIACQGERVKRPRVGFGEKVVRYTDYLAELRRKPQAVRQVSDELLAELGAPFDRLWRLLVDRHGPRDAARLFAKVLGAIDDFDHATVADAMQRALAEDSLDHLPLPTRSLVTEVSVPERLRHVTVESASASDFDVLLQGGGQ